MSHTSLLSYFFGYWLIVVGIISSFGLFSIWQRLKRKGDYGLAWLAWSIALWAIGGVLALISEGLHPVWETFWFSTVSIINGVFILLALPYFEHQHKWLKRIFRDKAVARGLTWGLAGIFWVTTLGWAVSMRKFDEPSVEPLPGIRLSLDYATKIIEAINWVSFPDWIFALITSSCLLLMFGETFKKRKIPNLRYLSAVILVITMLVQTLKLLPTKGYIYLDAGELNPDSSWHILYASRYIGGAIFMTLLVMLFFALAYSSHEADAAEKLKETVNKNDQLKEEKKALVEEHQSKIENFEKEKEKLIKNNNDLGSRLAQGNEQLVLMSQGLYGFHLFIEIPDLLDKQIIKFSPASYKDLVSLINQRLYSEEEEEFLAIDAVRIDRIAQDIIKSAYDLSSRDAVTKSKNAEWRRVKSALFETATEANLTLKVSGSHFRLKFSKQNIFSPYDSDSLKKIIKAVAQQTEKEKKED